MLDKQLLFQVQVLEDLHSFFLPHTGQIEVGNAIFYQGKQFVFVECGRKFGKTELINYFLYRMAMCAPNTSHYYIAPFAKQAGELIWDNGRLPNFLPQHLKDKYIAGINNQEMRIRFKNGSQIKLDGSDMHQAYRGINPHSIAYDEFKDHHPMFHEGMEPNLATFQAPILIVGTPPLTDDNLFCRLADECKNNSQGDSAYFNMPTHTNPHISAKYLEKIKQKLIERGEYDVYQREYEAKRVKGGSQSIFPMFDKTKHQVPYKELVKELRQNYKKYNFHVVADPGTAKVFGVLFYACHIYDKRTYLIDEIYAKKGSENTTKSIKRKIDEKINEIHPVSDDWNRTYDEAATWFANEMLYEYEENWTPTQKAMNKKENGLSLIKDQMLHGFWYCTERCEHLMSEIENYVKDKNGKIPKENDHLIDCNRYANASENYASVPERGPEKKDPDLEARFKTIERDIEDDRLNKDWSVALLGDIIYDD